MAKKKPPCSPEGSDSNKLTNKHKGKSLKTNKFRFKKACTKTQGPELEAETDFKGQFANLEGYIFDLGPRASDKFSRTMQDLDRYIGITSINRC